MAFVANVSLPKSFRSITPAMNLLTQHVLNTQIKTTVQSAVKEKSSKKELMTTSVVFLQDSTTV
jgi:DNA-binding FrmR family transcriptional regulator